MKKKKKKVTNPNDAYQKAVNEYYSRLSIEKAMNFIFQKRSF
jgi:hypothetical protein